MNIIKITRMLLQVLGLLLICNVAYAQQLLFNQGNEIYSWNYTDTSEVELVFAAKSEIKDFVVDTLLNQMIISDENGRIQFLALPSFEETFCTGSTGYFDYLPVFSPSGKYFVAGNRSWINLYQSEGNYLLRQIPISDFHFENISFAGKDDIVFLVGSDKIVLLNLISQEIEKEINFKGNYSAVVPSADKKLFCIYNSYSYSEKFSFSIFNIENSELKTLEILFDKGMTVNKVNFDMDNNMKIYLYTDNLVFIHDLATGKTKKIYESSLAIKSGKGGRDCVALFVESDSWKDQSDSTVVPHLVIIDSYNSSAKKYQHALKKDGALQNFQFAGQFSFLAGKDSSVPDDNNVNVFIQRQIKVNEIYISDKGNFYITSTDDDMLILWDARSLRQLRKLNCANRIFSKGDIQIDEEKKQIACKCEKNSYDDLIRIFDLQTGQVIKEIETDKSLAGFSLHNEIYFTSTYGSNPSLETFEFNSSIATKKIDSRINRVKYHNEKRWLIGVDGNNIMFFNDKDTSAFTSIGGDKNAEYIRDFTVSPDGSKLLIQYPFEGSVLNGGYNRWEVFDIQNKKNIATGKLPFGIESIDFSFDSKSVYYLHYDDTVNSDGYNFMGVFKQDLSEGNYTRVYQFFPGTSGDETLAAFPLTNKVIFCNDYHIYSVNSDLAVVENQSPPGIAEEYTSISLYNDGGNAVLRTDRSIHLIDFHNPKNYCLLKSESQFGILIMAGESFWIEEDTAGYWEDKRNFRVTYALKDARNTSEEKGIILENEVLENALMLKDKTNLLLRTYSNNKYRYCLYNIEQENIHAVVSIKSDEINLVSNESFSLTSDEQILMVPCKSRKKKNELKLYDVRNNFKFLFTLQETVRAFPTCDPKLIIIEKVNQFNIYSRDYWLFDVDKKTIVRKIVTIDEGLTQITVTSDNRFMIAAYKNYFVKFPLDSEVLLEEVKSHSFYYPLGATSAGNFFLIYGYNVVSWYDSENGEEQFRLTGSADQGVMLQLPGGEYYVLSGSKPDYVTYVVKDKAYLFDQFDLMYNRPDKLMAAIGYSPDDLISLYKKAYLKRLAKMNIKESNNTDLHTIPQVRVDIDNIPLLSTSGEVEFSVLCTDKGHEISRINVWINDVPMYGSGGLPVEKDEAQELSKTLRLFLSEGKNKIQISCHNFVGLESLKETFDVFYKPVQKKKSRLFFIALSVSHYKDSLYNLNYAVKDGRDLTVLFSKLTAEYDTIHLDTLFDQNALRDNILALKNNLLKTSVEDHVILFISGHGLLDESYNWWFATHDIDFRNPSVSGVSYDELEWLLDSIPARKKLLLMDACHSGEVDIEEMEQSDSSGSSESAGNLVAQNFKGAVLSNSPKLGLQNSFTLMQELFLNLKRGSGAHVISAAAGNSYAYELGELRNGVFTYSVRMGLEKREADLNRDKIITVSELKAYVSKHVESLTRGAQKPTSRQENLEYDFRVW